MKALKIFLKASLFLLIAGAVFFLGYFLFFQKEFTSACNSCHEMRTHRGSLELARHDKIECGDCHEQSAVYRMLLAKMFAGKKKFGDIKISSAKCSECHPRMEDKTVFYHDTIFSHKAHLEEGEKCVTCHKQFVHRSSPKEELLSIRLCRSCHQKKRRRHTPPTQIADLGLLEKQPHGENWYVDHKTISASEKKACAKCHHKDFCVNCHTNFEAHVSEWWANHYDDAMMRLAECQICHRPAYCISCHSKTVPVTHNKAWGMSHWLTSDLETCNNCHTLNFCKACHTREMPSSHKNIKDHAGMKIEREPTCNICHGENSCSSCHHHQNQNSPCLECHQSIVTSPIRAGGKNFSHKSHIEKRGITCAACHKVSETPGRFAAPQGCGDCHHKTTKKACADCHERQKSLVRHSGMNFPCEFCHERDEGDFSRPGRKCVSCHALMFEQEAQVHGANSCARCHPTHSRRALPSESCRECHAKAISKHAEKDIADCGRCHKPHSWNAN